MRALRGFGAAIAALAFVGTAAAEEITVDGVHNCCGACCKKIVAALEGVEGVSEIKATPKDPKVAFSAADNKTARKALGALARAGFHGKVEGGKKLKMPANSGVEAGKVKSLDLVGIHNCCPGCINAVKDALGKVDGVDASTISAKGRAVKVEGDFDGQAAVKALTDAGFHVRKKGAAGKKRKKIQQKIQQKIEK